MLMEHPELPLLCVSDARAGNQRQVEALAQALGQGDAPHVTLLPDRRARWLAPHRFPGAATALGDAFAACLANPPSLALGCGRQAALATRLLRRAGSRVVQILDPRMSLRHWDIVVAPEHDGLVGSNVVSVCGSLHPVNDVWLAAARGAFPAFAERAGLRVALLVGGPGKHWPLSDASFQAALVAIQAAVAELGGQLWVSASRRTPPAWQAAIRHCGAARIWCDGSDGDNPYRGFLAWADVLLVTADSVNMLSEAAATHAPLYIVAAQRQSGRAARFVGHLLDIGRARPWQGELAAFACSPMRETERIADEVRARLGR